MCIVSSLKQKGDHLILIFVLTNNKYNHEINTKIDHLSFDVDIVIWRNFIPLYL